MELRQIGQSKVSFGGRGTGTHGLLRVQQRAEVALTMPRHNAACASAFSQAARRCTALPLGHQPQVQPAVLSSGEGRGMGAVSKMHGMRLKVNSDTDTEERGRRRGMGRWKPSVLFQK